MGARMSRDMSEVIDDYSLDTYGHTNWAYVSTLDDEQKSWAGTIEGEVKYYHEDKCWGCDMIISKCEDSDYCKQIKEQG